MTENDKNTQMPADTNTENHTEKTSPSEPGRKKKNHKNTILIILIVVAAVLLWEEVLEDRVIPKRFGQVVPGLLCRSGYLSEPLIEKVLTKHKIDLIVDLTNDVPGDKRKQAEKDIAAKLGVEIQRFPLAGNGTGDFDTYADAVVAVTKSVQNQRPTLVHCAAGSQRTGGVVAYYRLLVEGKSPDFVIREMKKYDWEEEDVDLLNYVNEHMAQMAEVLKEKGLIETIPDPLPKLEI